MSSFFRKLVVALSPQEKAELYRALAIDLQRRDRVVLPASTDALDKNADILREIANWFAPNEEANELTPAEALLVHESNNKEAVRRVMARTGCGRKDAEKLVNDYDLKLGREW